MILLSLIIAGCSVTRRNTAVVYQEGSGKFISTDRIIALNVTNYDFNILKAEIEIKNEIESRKMIGNLKYKKPGTYLISLRSQAGIEAARIYVSMDTILINDRLNKKLYYGSPEHLLNKYGISTSILPVIVGDYISEEADNIQIKCTNNQASIRQITGDKEILYNISCGKRKVTDIISTDPLSGKGISIKFDKFEESENILMARKIKIADSAGETSISINIMKVEPGRESEITFIPGKNYEKVLLR